MERIKIKRLSTRSCGLCSPQSLAQCVAHNRYFLNVHGIKVSWREVAVHLNVALHGPFPSTWCRTLHGALYQAHNSFTEYLLGTNHGYLLWGIWECAN